MIDKGDAHHEPFSAWRALAEHAPNFLTVVDRDHTIVFINNVAPGLAMEEVIGSSVYDLVSLEFHEQLRSHIDAALAGADAVTIEATAVGPDGATVSYESRVGPIHGEVGINHVALIATDITERKRAEQERVSLQRQLHEAQKMEAIASLAGGIAHDFNNALTGILANSSLALMDLDRDDPLHEIFEDIVESANRAAELTRKLVAFGRRQVFEKCTVEIGKLLEEIEPLLDRLLGEHIEIVWRHGASVGPVRVDLGEFEQVILNVALNARDAMPQGGRLIFETGEIEFSGQGFGAPLDISPGRYVALAICDDGVGMQPEVLERVFEPFFTTKEFGIGTGLGMATAFGIIRQHDGWIAVESKPGMGTTFTLYLPCTEGATSRPSHPTPDADPCTGTGTT